MITAIRIVALVVLVCAFCVLLPIRLFQKVRGWEQDAEAAPRTSLKAKLALAGVLVALGVAAIAYQLLVQHHLEQTAALFIGLPVLLSTLLVVLTNPRSATGIACKGTAVALLMSGLFLGEGFICIVMAAPLFFAVAVIIGSAIDFGRRARKTRSTMTCLLLFAFVPMSLEGVRPHLSFPREQTVTVEQVVPKSAAEVEKDFAATPQFRGTLPAYLQLGFPRPAGARGSGLMPGAERVIHFAGGEGKPGALIARVTQADSSHVVFQLESDTSHIAHWLRWESAEVEWVPEGAQTRVRWTVRYRRLLDPAWYFAPWERYAVGLAGRYLLQNLVGAQP